MRTDNEKKRPKKLNGGQELPGELPGQQVLPGIPASEERPEPAAAAAGSPPMPPADGSGKPPESPGSSTQSQVPPITSALFDVNRLKLSQGYAPAAMVKPILTRIDPRKPHDQEFIRVHPDYVVDLSCLKDRAHSILDLERTRQNVTRVTLVLREHRCRFRAMIA